MNRGWWYYRKGVYISDVPRESANLEEGGAGAALEDEEQGKADHGGAAVEQLGLGGEGPELLLLGALHDGNQGGRGEQREVEQDLRLAHRHLGHDRLAGGELGAEGGDEPEHGEAAVDDLRGRAEGHRVLQPVQRELPRRRGRGGQRRRRGRRRGGRRRGRWRGRWRRRP